MSESFSDLDALSADDPVIRNLARTMRDGRGVSLEQAVAEAREYIDHARVDAAAARIRELAEQIQTAQNPRAVVAGNIESWYAGPRAEDQNWTSLVEILEADGWGGDALRDLDDASTKVVAQLPNPHGQTDYQCRGLVLGYVQSGKTTNFTAVIAKAADAGYRFFIVLSGIHDALRQQTQDRLNEQLWERNPDLWNRLTNEGDFRATANVDALLATRNQRVLAIVKKNGPRLRALNKWLFAARANVLADCPVLIIDDEADQATVNTAKPDRQPSTINSLIRSIVNKLPKSAYVGYTATPFANVLIDPKNYEDLYPRDFIVDLPRPEIYIGPEAIFGREPIEFDAEDVGDDGHDFVRSVAIEEIDGLRPRGAATRHEFEPTITPSLDEALKYFLLSTAARRIRAKGNRHATALVHTSQHIDVHERLAEAISSHLESLAKALARRDADLVAALEFVWQEECKRVPASDFGQSAVEWDDVLALLPAVAEDAVVVTDNSRSTERLNFDDSDPRVIVAVGGNTLSRGLTLEGLAVSFFVRTASAYDTLLQMGRWFGYRNGYADLTRIWMTDEMREWFHHLATVEQEIRYDIERYEREHVKPDVLGVNIRTHPKLAITAASKMQTARQADISYSGRRIQTILFNHRDPDWLGNNIAAVKSLMDSVHDSVITQVRPGITVVGPVSSVRVVEFLDAYKFHENSRDLDSGLLRRYIEARREEGELMHFKIAIMARAGKSDYLGDVDLGLPELSGCINRARLKVVGGATYADIKTLMSRNDRVIDLGISAAELSGEITNADMARMRNLPSQGGRGDGSGILLVYPVSKDSRPVRGTAKTRIDLKAADHVIGLGLVFPESSSRAAKLEYLTADVASMSVEVEAPDEADEPDESDADRGAM
ncbi:Z1 domain-containing protein [Kribbella sp. VKM Ac-2568]|uniref:Z1 domain-containing protein n=1 Tax=Kribbella sp. VKM Ac-2568 TaxID=2512219 RepID=UPI00104AD398|nr:Z1 domain-containing protein [Kribbella sp. VKM Ac-2568]TCM39649.1 Z1 domain-containing protein [Kribbella sp. VKM Ac-2568]